MSGSRNVILDGLRACAVARLVSMTECDYIRCDAEAEYTTGGGGAFCQDHYVEKMRLAHETEGYLPAE